MAKEPAGYHHCENCAFEMVFNLSDVPKEGHKQLYRDCPICGFNNLLSPWLVSEVKCPCGFGCVIVHPPDMDWWECEQCGEKEPMPEVPENLLTMG